LKILTEKEFDFRVWDQKKADFKKNLKKDLKIYKFFKWKNSDPKKYDEIINKVYLIWMIRNAYFIAIVIVIVNLNKSIVSITRLFFSFIHKFMKA
jgi:hypothetical protein